MIDVYFGKQSVCYTKKDIPKIMYGVEEIKNNQRICNV